MQTLKNGRYKILNVIQHGPRAIIRLVADSYDQNILKIVKSSIGVCNKQSLTGIRHENAVLSHLFHKYIIRRTDYWEDQEGAHLALEYVRGITLYEYLSQNKTNIQEQQLIVLACKIIEALGASHRKGFIHGDLKPSNIMIQIEDDESAVNEKTRIEIIDWETASQIGEKAHRAWTRAYASPEAWLRKPLDQTHDFYSLGVIFHECMTGNIPFKKDGIMVKEDVLEKPPPAIPELSRELNTILTRLLAKDRRLRFENDNELLEALSASQGCRTKVASKGQSIYDNASNVDEQKTHGKLLSFCEDALIACLIYLLLSLLFKVIGWTSFSGNVTIALLTGVLLTVLCEINIPLWIILFNILFFLNMGIFSLFLRHSLETTYTDHFVLALVSIFIGLCNGFWNIETREEDCLP